LRMQGLLQRLLAEKTGQPLERIQRDFERDYFMDPYAAVEYGLIDHVVGQPDKPVEELSKATAEDSKDAR